MFTAAADTWTWFFCIHIWPVLCTLQQLQGLLSTQGMRLSCFLFQPWRHGSDSIIAESWAVVHTLAWNIARRQCWNRAFCDGGIISTFWFLWQKNVFRTWLTDEAYPPPCIWMNSSFNASNLASICKGWNGLSSSSTMHSVLRGEHFIHAEKHILLERPFIISSWQTLSRIQWGSRRGGEPHCLELPEHLQVIWCWWLAVSSRSRNSPWCCTQYWLYRNGEDNVWEWRSHQSQMSWSECLRIRSSEHGWCEGWSVCRLPPGCTRLSYPIQDRHDQQSFRCS